MLGSPDGLLPVDDAVNPQDATMWHPALEFDRGLPAPLPGRPLAPAANRILIGYDPVNADFRSTPASPRHSAIPHWQSTRCSSRDSARCTSAAHTAAAC